jgi:hypothetical protein
MIRWANARDLEVGLASPPQELAHLLHKSALEEPGAQPLHFGQVRYESRLRLGQASAGPESELSPTTV